jgi:hypothetical protein
MLACIQGVLAAADLNVAGGGSAASQQVGGVTSSCQSSHSVRLYRYKPGGAGAVLLAVSDNELLVRGCFADAINIPASQVTSSNVGHSCVAGTLMAWCS